MSKLVFQINITRTGQTVYIEVVAEEITIIEISGETFVKTALEEAVSEIVNLIINIIYYYHFFNKKSIIYIGNLNIG